MRNTISSSSYPLCTPLLRLLLCATILLLLLQDIDVAYATDPAIFDDFEADLTSLLEVPDLDFSSSQDFPRATYRDSAFASTSAAAGKNLNRKEKKGGDQKYKTTPLASGLCSPSACMLHLGTRWLQVYSTRVTAKHSSTCIQVIMVKVMMHTGQGLKKHQGLLALCSQLGKCMAHFCDACYVILVSSDPRH